MWGTRGNTYDEKDGKPYGSSMKWHLADEESLEERDFEVGYGDRKKVVKKTFGYLMCGGKKHSWIIPATAYGAERDARTVLTLRESINLGQANVCAYCKQYKMKELGIPNTVIA